MSQLLWVGVIIIILAVLIDNTLIGKILVEIVGVAGVGYLVCFPLLAHLGVSYLIQRGAYIIILALLLIDIFHRIKDGC